MYKERGNACLEDLQKSSPLPVFLPCFAGAFNLGGYASINILLWLWHESQEAGKDAVETCLTLQMLPLISISCVFLLHPTLTILVITFHGQLYFCLFCFATGSEKSF